MLGLAGLAGFGFIGRSHPPTTSDEERQGWSDRLGNKLFLPALIIPATALIGTLAYNYTPLGTYGWIEAKRETYVFLGLGVLFALGAIFAWLRPPAIAPLQEGRRLIDAIGWAAVLPQMLASLGVLFAAAGVGDAIGSLTRMVIPEGSIFLTVAVFGLGMAIFTMVMGNAFAAFPVMAAAIGVPLLIQGYGGDPAVVGAIGMLAGFCGTLMTPMAANFNLVPAALLELKDQYGVIRAQVATALPLLARQHPAHLLAGVPMMLDADLAAQFARIALGHVARDYPYKLDHVLLGDEDALSAARAAPDLLRQLRLA